MQPSGFRPDNTRAASFLNCFKNIPGKACVKRVHNNDAFLNVGTPHSTKEEVLSGFKTTARGFSSTI